MAQIQTRLNTQGMAFPLLSQQSGRTVIDGRGDLTYIPGVTAEGDIPEDRGTPGVYYAHNVMPTAYGWQGVGYTEVIPAAVSGTFTQMMLVQGATVTGNEKPQPSGLRTYVAKVHDGAGNATLSYLDGTGNWAQLTNTPTFQESYEISVAYVNGYTYICVPFTNIYVIDVATGTLLSRDIIGIDETTIEGVVTASGYLLLWTARRILWSSTIDVEDFVPSEVTGAGGGAVQEAKGAIIYCVGTPLGILAFTDLNIVSGVYTGNEDFPFEFKDVPSSGGVYSHNLVSRNAAGGYYYAFTTNGIQRIAHTGANTILSNVSDFIGGRVFEDFNDSTQSLDTLAITIDMPRGLNVVGNRYIIVSYRSTADGPFTHAIVVDAIQGRMGKLKIPHYQIIERRATEAGTAADSRGTIAALGPDGKVSQVNFSLECQTTTAVMLLGKIQMVHSRLLQLQEVELENVCPSGNFEMLDYPSLDGKTFEPTVSGFENPDDAGKSLKRYFFSNVAVSHSLMFKGSFELVSILLHFNIHGRR